MPMPSPLTSSASGKALAWGVHLFTASGVVFALLAIEAIGQGAWRRCLLWLIVALAVDGIDGTLARAAKVKDRLSRIDGAALDLVIDYLNYVLVPALLMWRAGLLPDRIAIALCAAILVSSLYIFARRDMKTEDGYFRGFPALWNVVAAYFVVLRPNRELAAAIVAALVVLTFAPIHVAHPFRARGARVIGPALALIWTISTACLIWLAPGPPQWPFLLGLSLASLFGLVSIGVIRTIRGDARS
jgi:phosphatidylcholine synthase